MRKTLVKILVLCALSLVALASVFAVNESASRIFGIDSKYRVFCANNKIEVEQRTLEQQKNARGSNVCELAAFDYLSDADNYAAGRGGKGSDCKCP